MKKKSTLIFSVFLLSFGKLHSAVNLYELYPNIHTIGIMVVFDEPVPESVTTEVYYEENQNGNWSPVKQGLELSRVTKLNYAGCIFWTKPNTEYRVRTIITDSSSVVMDQTQAVTTRSEPGIISPIRTFYVSPNGSGTSQNMNTPGSLDQSLLDSLIAGDKVVLLSGIYHRGELEIKSTGTEQSPIVFEGESGVIIDGSIPSYIQWTRVSTDTVNRDYNMFYTNLGSINTNCVIVDDKRMYPYRNRLELSLFQTIRAIDGNGYASGNFDIGLSGFFRDGRNPSGNYFPYIGYNPNTYIKFADGSDTTGKSINASRQAFAFKATAQSNIQFRNIEFKYFGAGLQRSALHLTDCDNILVDSCHFEFCDRGVSFYGNSDNNIVQHARFDDDFGDWTYLQFKETNEDYGQLNTFYPNYFPYNHRNIEPGRVYFDHGFTGRGNIIRYNVFNGGCDGISCPDIPGDSSTSRHFDIYGNEFMNGADDAFEVDGDAANIRVWGNIIHNVSGVSVASPCYGPVYVMRNVIYDLPTIDYSYIYFDIAGYHLYSEVIRASPLKVNSTYCDIPGVVYFLHNTCDVGTDGKGFYIQQPQAQSSWDNIISRNNIFYVESDDYSLWVRATDKVDLDYNNYYCTQTFTARQDRPGYGIYSSVQEVSQNILGDLNDSTSFIETHGYQLDPSTGWKNEAAHDYHLLPLSNMLDKGIHIPGVNDDYSETAPDLGAFELIVIRDTNSITDVIVSADTSFSRDTIELIQSGITDTTITSTTSIECDSLLIRGIIHFSTDSVFTDTLFITENFSQTDLLEISCNTTTVDSIFIPDLSNGLNDPLENSVTVYPNPNIGSFTISFSDDWEVTNIELAMLDLTGRVIYILLLESRQSVIQLPKSIEPGIYLLQINTTAQSLRKKLLVLNS